MPADLAVIGLGSHGLPLAQAAVGAGVDTIGYDPDRARDLASGRLPGTGAEGALTAADVRRMLSGGFRPTADPRELGRVRTAVICAPAPPAPPAASTSGRSPRPPARSRPDCGRTPRSSWSPRRAPAPPRSSCAPCWSPAPA